MSDRVTDAELDELARRLRQPVEAPRLWRRIEQTLDREEPLARAPAGRRRSRRPIAWFVAASALAAAWFLWTRAVSTSPKVLLDPVEDVVLSGELASLTHEWQELQRRLQDLDPERADTRLLARLHHVDANLDLCLATARRNPLNRAVRRSLLHSSRTKVEILKQLLAPQHPRGTES